jgi:RNA polymerase sigma factor (sigma-70 family)
VNSLENHGREDEALLLERVHTRARVMARRRVKSRERAEDIAQDVAMECLLRVRSGTWDVAPERLDAYLARSISRRRIYIRKKRRRDAARDWTYLSEISASRRAWMNPEVQWRERELAALYETTLQSLPYRCRQAFIAVREHGQSYADAARSQGVSVKMIAKFITEAQRVFRRVLRQHGIRVPPEKRIGRRARTIFVARPGVGETASTARRATTTDRAVAERLERQRAREAEFREQLAGLRRASAFLSAELAAREAEERKPVELEPVA